MRFLYLDDSGKIHANHDSKFAVFAGFSVDEGRWHPLVRQLNGAKAAFFPARPKPYDWEVKSTDFLTANAWNRSRRRGLCDEFARILERNGCHVYAIAMEKAQAVGALDEAKFVPLAFQRLIAKFNDEILHHASTGSIVCDWSTYQMDHHVTTCLNGMVISSQMYLLRGGITYGSSSALVPLQAADLIAGALRRSLEGQNHVDLFAANLRGLHYARPGGTDVLGYPVDSVLSLF